MLLRFVSHARLALCKSPQVVTNPHCSFDVKSVYMKFLLYCHIETDASMRDLYNADYVCQVLEQAQKDINQVSQLKKTSTFYRILPLKFVNDANNSKELECDRQEYICNELTIFIEKLFEKPTERTLLISAVEVKMLSCSFIKSSLQRHKSVLAKLHEALECLLKYLSPIESAHSSVKAAPVLSCIHALDKFGDVHFI